MRDEAKLRGIGPVASKLREFADFAEGSYNKETLAFYPAPNGYVQMGNMDGQYLMLERDGAGCKPDRFIWWDIFDGEQIRQQFDVSITHFLYGVYTKELYFDDGFGDSIRDYLWADNAPFFWGYGEEQPEIPDEYEEE